MNLKDAWKIKKLKKDESIKADSKVKQLINEIIDTCDLDAKIELIDTCGFVIYYEFVLLNYNSLRVLCDELENNNFNCEAVGDTSTYSKTKGIMIYFREKE